MSEFERGFADELEKIASMTAVRKAYKAVARTLPKQFKGPLDRAVLPKEPGGYLRVALTPAEKKLVPKMTPKEKELVNRSMDVGRRANMYRGLRSERALGALEAVEKAQPSVGVYEGAALSEIRKSPLAKRLLGVA